MFVFLGLCYLTQNVFLPVLKRPIYSIGRNNVKHAIKSHREKDPLDWLHLDKHQIMAKTIQLHLIIMKYKTLIF